MSLQELSQPNVITPEGAKIVFSDDLTSELLDNHTLLPSQTKHEIQPGDRFVMRVKSADPQVVSAFSRGDYTQPSRTAIVGFNVVDATVIEDEAGIQRTYVHIQNISPIPLTVQREYPMVRAILEKPVTPLRGRSLLDQAIKMGNPGKLALRTLKGDVVFVDEIAGLENDESFRKYLDDQGPSAFTEILCVCSPEIGNYGRSTALTTEDLIGRADGLEGLLGIEWVNSTHLRDLGNQRHSLVLRRTDGTVTIPEGYAALVKQQPVYEDGLRHGRATILEGIKSTPSQSEASREFRRGKWPIIFEFQMPADKSWSLPSLVALELYEAA